MLAHEPNGTIVGLSFGHDEIGDVSFLGLHGFNIKKHMQRRLVLRGSVGGPLSFLLVGLRFGGCLNKTTMRSAVHVLAAGGTIQVSTPMFCNLV